ncbi:hypothetical protein VKT23_015346 [Stygiomarasmius scandens]|uniref:Uncharacterized protein n=1 Tax=Marasmiellus scandens TaxID=2682957 RepID=A0ABR1J2N0_9AGAR
MSSGKETPNKQKASSSEGSSSNTQWFNDNRYANGVNNGGGTVNFHVPPNPPKGGGMQVLKQYTI